MKKSYLAPALMVGLSIVLSACADEGAMATAHAQQEGERFSLDSGWKEKQIADALRAAPPSVTRDAAIYAWTEAGERVLARVYRVSFASTCIAEKNPAFLV